MNPRKSLSPLLVLLLAISLVCCSPEERRATAPEGDCQTILASLSELRDFQFRDSISVYSPENLHHYIDGGAEFYLQNGFVNLATALLASGETGQEISVEIYQMREASQANFIYRTERGDSPDDFQVGDRGYRNRGYAAFVKGVFLVKLMAYEATEDQLEALAALAKSLEAKIQP